MNPYELIDKYCGDNHQLREILLRHSEAVRDHSLRIAGQHPEMNLDLQFIGEAALLHDIGIIETNAPTIHCHGTHRYIEHGYLGADILRKEGLDRHALVCERHTGTGLTLDYIKENNLPLPHRDLTPQTLEEKLICFADKFHSKTHLDETYDIATARRKLEKFGEETIAQFDHWVSLFL